LILFDFILLDIPNLTENNIHYGYYSFCNTADLQLTSTFLFHFHFHVLDADGLRNHILNCSRYIHVNPNMQSEKQYFLLSNQSFDDIPKDIQQLYIYHYYNEDITALNVSDYSFNIVQSITIGNHCFTNVREFVIDSVESLESVKIGEYCFRISGDERNDGVCRITNCPNLRQLEIGGDSFADFKSFELSNVNSLQSIKFDWHCFEYADFSLKGE